MWLNRLNVFCIDVCTDISFCIVKSVVVGCLYTPNFNSGTTNTKRLQTFDGRLCHLHVNHVSNYLDAVKSLFDMGCKSRW